MAMCYKYVEGPFPGLSAHPKQEFGKDLGNDEAILCLADADPNGVPPSVPGLHLVAMMEADRCSDCFHGAPAKPHITEPLTLVAPDRSTFKFDPEWLHADLMSSGLSDALASRVSRSIADCFGQFSSGVMPTGVLATVVKAKIGSELHFSPTPEGCLGCGGQRKYEHAGRREFVTRMMADAAPAQIVPAMTFDSRAAQPGPIYFYAPVNQQASQADDIKALVDDLEYLVMLPAQEGFNTLAEHSASDIGVLRSAFLKQPAEAIERQRRQYNELVAASEQRIKALLEQQGISDDQIAQVISRPEQGQLSITIRVGPEET